MSDEDKPQPDRRNVLKAIGAAGAIGTLGTSTVSALEGDEKTARIEEATRTDSFETFESDFGEILVDTGESRVTQQGETGERTVRVELATNFGKVGVITLEKGDESVDITLLDLATANADAIPDAYANVPEGTNPLAFATSESDGVEFRREATRREKEVLARKTGIPVSELEVNFETERGGFVVGGGSELNEDDYALVELNDVAYREVDPSQIEARTVTTEEVSTELSAWCAYKCASCLSKAAGCAGCCIATSIGCIACIIWNCGVGASSCYDCYDCLS